MEIKDMKVILKMEYLKEKEQNIMKMEIKIMKEIINIINLKEKE